MKNSRSRNQWRYLHWEEDEPIDFPLPRDSGPAELLTTGGETIKGTLCVTIKGDELPMIGFEADDGRRFSFFDAIAWRRLAPES